MSRAAPGWRPGKWGSSRLFFAWLVVLSIPAGVRAEPGPALVLRVEAGEADREPTPVSVEIDGSRLARIPGRLPLLGDATAASAREIREGGDLGPPVPVEVDHAEPGSPLRLTWVLPDRSPAVRVRRFRLEPAPPGGGRSPWWFSDRPDGTIELKNRDRTVFRYQKGASSHPNFGPELVREAYIHPAFTPSGALVTGDFSRAHPHHRGFFLAYTKTRVGDLHPDFWNFQTGTGRIACDRVGQPGNGPVVARLATFHRWEARGAGLVMTERWDLAAYDIPGQPYWLFDLTSTQQATGRPLELVPYRYGGMAYRGPDPFLPRGKLDVLTSEGLGRVEGDQKPARWVDLTGPVADGSDRYAGAMIADHPENPHHPTVARIHPTTLPFFCFVPGHDRALTIDRDRPTVFRYRILIHDGHPDRARDDRIWSAFARPPRVVVESN